MFPNLTIPWCLHVPETPLTSGIQNCFCVDSEPFYTKNDPIHLTFCSFWLYFTCYRFYHIFVRKMVAGMPDKVGHLVFNIVDLCWKYYIMISKLIMWLHVHGRGRGYAKKHLFYLAFLSYFVLNNVIHISHTSSIGLEFCHLILCSCKNICGPSTSYIQHRPRVLSFDFVSL